jgi:hypothetical protein
MYRVEIEEHNNGAVYRRDSHNSFAHSTIEAALTQLITELLRHDRPRIAKFAEALMQPPRGGKE